MGAPSVPVETPVEVPVEEPVAEPAEVASPPEGGEEAEPDSGSLLREHAASLSADELRLLIEAAPAEERSKLEKEYEGRGEQRALNRKKESEQKTSERLAQWKPYVDNLPNAHAYVNQQIANLKAGNLLDNPQLFEQVQQQIVAGTVGQMLLANESYVPTLVEKYLPDLTAEEAEKLDKPLYRFGQTGLAKEAVDSIIEAIVERREKEAFEKGVAKGEGNLKARETLLEKLTNAQKVKNETAGVSPNGKAVSISDERARLKAEIAAFDPSKMTFQEAQEKLQELRAKERSLGS